MMDLSGEADRLGMVIDDLIPMLEKAAAGEDAVAAGADKAAGATNKATAAADKRIAGLEKENQLLKVNLDEQKAQIAALEKSAAAYAAQGAAAKGAAISGSATFNKLDKISQIATPGILKAATWGILGVGGIGYEAIKTYSKLNAELMQSITQAGRNPNSMPFLTQTAIKTAKQTGVGLNDVANMIYRISSATANMNKGYGATNKQLAQMTKQVANLSVLGGIASGAPMEQSARVMGAIANSNLVGLGVNPAKIAAYVNAVTGAGDIRQSELNSALGRGALSVAAAHGMSANSLGAFIDLLTSKGTPGATAGQYARTAITMLASPSAQGARALAMVGIKPGSINELLAGKGGIVAVAQYLHDALSRFNPTAFNVKYKGATGAAGATALLQNWGVGDIPQAVINAWAAGTLGSQSKDTAGFGGKSGTTWLNTLQNLIITKAFGGSKSSATIDAMLNDPAALAGISAAIARNSSAAVYNRDVQKAMNTPQAQFSRMRQSIMADLVSIGKSLTPAAITLGKILTGVADALGKFKILLIPIISTLGVIAGIALTSKLAGLAVGGYRVLGAGYAATSKMWGVLGGGKETGMRSIFTKLGGGGREFQKVYSGVQGKQLAVLEEIAINTRQTAVEAGVGAMGGMGRSGRGFGAVEKKVMRDVEKKALASGKPVTRSLLRGLYKETGVVGSATGKEASVAIESSMARVGEGAVAKGIGSRLLGMGLSGLSGLAGFAGGPIGMMAMSMLMPMAMPLVGKAISGVAGLFSGLFGGGSAPKNTFKPKVVTNLPTNPADVARQILVDKALQASLQNKIANGTATLADYAELNKVSNRLKKNQDSQGKQC